MKVVSNTSPIHYLVQVDAIGVLPQIYGQVLVPPEVVTELSDPATPTIVSEWLRSTPDWLLVQTPTSSIIAPKLHPGESASIALAMEIHADFVIIDDRVGRMIALSQGLTVIGTLGVLADAAAHDLLNLESVLDRLEQSTNFYLTPKLRKATETEMMKRKAALHLP